MTPDNIYAKEYGNIVFPKSQQEGSRLRNTIMVKSGVKGEETYMDQINSFAALPKGARLADTDPTLASFDRRRISLEDFYVAKAWEKMDDIRTLADPTSAIVRNGINAMGRKIDDIIIAAATGTAYTGKTGTTAVTFPTSTNQIAAGSANLTLAKWLDALEVLNANDVDPSEEKFIIIGSSQLTSLLTTTEIKSADYNSVKALVQGQVNEFLGCKVIRSERLNKSGNNRTVLLYTKNSMGIAFGQDVVSRMDELPGKHYAKQLYFSMSCGASRLEEAKVVSILCDETA